MAIERKPLAAQWYDMALGAAAVLGAAVAVLALHVIHAAGGFYMPAPATGFADGKILVHNLGMTAQGLLLLGGADFLGSARRPAPSSRCCTWSAWSWRHGERAWRRGASCEMVTGSLSCSSRAWPSTWPPMCSAARPAFTQVREIAPVLPFSAVLAGRLLGGQVLAGRLKPPLLVPLLLVVLLGYLLGLTDEISQPPVAAQNQQLTSWLAARHLQAGLSGYWESNVVTLTSGDRVQIRLLKDSRQGLVPSSFEGKAEWYDPRHNTANFVVLFPGVAEYNGFTQEQAVLTLFGKPARTYNVGAYTILVWDKNLLRELSRVR